MLLLYTYTATQHTTKGKVMLMCGIGGFSLSKKSRINSRSLSNALLAELDARGNQASGYAYQTKDTSGVYKKDVAGARLNLRGLPKNAKTVILHTRYATHGTTKDMANNHPVQSPDSSINLVHNGVIYNHDLVRTSLDYKLPEVDSSVIPAILQKHNRDVNKFDMLDGDASVAWLDDSDRGTLRLARISHSPLVIAQLKDGSFIFASTETILHNALQRLGLRADFMQSVSERTLLEVRLGVVKTQQTLPDTDPAFVDKSWYSSYGQYRNMTSGNHCSSTPARSRAVQSLWGDVIVSSDWYYSGDEYLDDADFVYPHIDGLSVDGNGEYYDDMGYYIGNYDDMVEWGFI